MKQCLAGAADGQPRIGSNSGDRKHDGVFLGSDERRGRQDGRVLVEGGGDGDGGRGDGGGEEDAGSNGGELLRMLELLPQRMADLEELALADGLDDEVSFRGAVPRLQQTALHFAFWEANMSTKGSHIGLPLTSPASKNRTPAPP